MGTPSSLRKVGTWHQAINKANFESRGRDPKASTLAAQASHHKTPYFQGSKLSLVQHLDWRPSTAPFHAGTPPSALSKDGERHESTA